MGGAWANPEFKPVSPSRAVWGDYGNGKLGIPLIVETLREYGLSGTFFVEAFTDEQGYPGEMESVCHYLLDHGQDVQLHVHPNHKHYALKLQGKPFPFTDQMADLNPGAQRELLAEGSQRIERWTGRRPVAFRAGNMGASEETLRQLAAVGIRIDSSYTFPYAGGRCYFGPQDPYNGSKWYGDVLELALSGFYQRKLPLMHPAKKVDPVGVSFAECRDAIRAICGAGADAVLILHSFSLFKVRDVQYNRGRLDRIITQRFRRICAWLAGDAEEHPTLTFRELAEAVEAGQYEARAVPPCRLDRPVRAVVRKGVQAWNNLYWT